MNPTVVNIIILLLLGFIVGWGLEFGADLVFWRRRAATRDDDEYYEEGRQSIKSASASPASDADVRMLRAALSERDGALVDVQHQVSARREELARMRLLVQDHENTVTHLNAQLEQHKAESKPLHDSPPDEVVSKDAEVVSLQEQLSTSERELARNAELLEQHETQIETLQAELAGNIIAGDAESVEARLTAMSAELEATKVELGKREVEALEVDEYLQQRNSETERLAALLSDANASLDHYRQREVEQVIVEKTEYVQQDDLTDIKGIGAVYDGKLHDAGYHTFHHLAEANAEVLKATLDVPDWRLPKLQEWIEQARTFVEEKEQKELEESA